MQIYYSDIDTIHQKTLQLAEEPCPHCQQTHQQVSHGFVYKKKNQGAPFPVGKRVYCSNRRQDTGCGRTTQLYVASVIRYLHHASTVLVAFVIAMIKGLSIQTAYHQTTGADTHRNAYRWMQRLINQLSFYRRLVHQPCLKDSATFISTISSLRRCLITSTFQALLLHFGEPLGAHYQQQLNQTFLP